MAAVAEINRLPVQIHKRLIERLHPVLGLPGLHNGIDLLNFIFSQKLTHRRRRGYHLRGQDPSRTMGVGHQAHETPFPQAPRPTANAPLGHGPVENSSRRRSKACKQEAASITPNTKCPDSARESAA